MDIQIVSAVIADIAPILVTILVAWQLRYLTDVILMIYWEIAPEEDPLDETEE